MLEGNEKNLLAKFAIMDTSLGESKPVQVATESSSSSQKWVPGAKRASISEERQRPLQGGCIGTHASTFFSFLFFSHFVLRYWLVHLKQMHLWPPFKFSILMVPEAFPVKTFQLKTDRTRNTPTFEQTRSFAS